MGPIRKTVRLIFLSLLVPVLCVTTAWADILDPCDSTSGPGSYQNLSAPSQNYIRWSDPPDKSYLCQQNNQRTATALYRCTDAQEVTVAIYSRHGSYAGYSGGELVRGGDELPLWYQSSTGEVYCDGRRMVYDADRRDFVFLEEEGRPSGLVEYGLSVYCSEDGSDYTRVSAQLISAWQEGPSAYWYEEYRAQLEEGTRYLRLVLTDQSDIEILGREERYRFETTGGLSLASVEIIEGSNTERTHSDDDEIYGENAWETEESGTGSLPSYQPGEEEGPGSLPWGPEEDPEDGGPAFPEETEGGEDAPISEEGSSGGGASSSRSSASSSASGASSQKGSSQPLIGRNGWPEEEASEPAAPAEAGSSTPALRQEVPLWRRVTEPDAMTMMIISLILIVMGFRVLWEGSGGNKPGKRGAWKEREERYARYISPDSDLRYDRGSRERETKRTTRRGRLESDDEDWEDPEI